MVVESCELLVSESSSSYVEQAQSNCDRPVVTPNSRFLNSDGKKALVPKLNESGSSTLINKRPADDVISASQSSAKKTKLSDASTSKRNKDTLNVRVTRSMKKLIPDNQSPTAENVVTPLHMLKGTNKNSKSSNVSPAPGGYQKWTTLVHNGVILPPSYNPHGVKMLYKGQPVDLTPKQEEVATMYAVLLKTEYVTKPKFNENFMKDWLSILGKDHVIQSLEHCDFTPIYEWHQNEQENKKQITYEKMILQNQKHKNEAKYTWAIVDGVKKKVFNFRVEPPGLFRGRGNHSKMGKLKERIRPSDIVINVGKDAPIPECAISGESWKVIMHDNTVPWLACWHDPSNCERFIYASLDATATFGGESEMMKFEKARRIKVHIQSIREAYTKNLTSKDSRKKQLAVATYLISKLALIAGNEKDDDEADTVGCCTLKVENVEPLPPSILKIDLPGKDSIRYQNELEIENAVFKAIQQFRNGKEGSDNLFDELDTKQLNAYIKKLIPGLTAKILRTCNASNMFDEMLSGEVKEGEVAEIVANAVDYIDPRITIAWCKRNQVPIEKVLNGSHMEKFAWAMEVGTDFRY